jgi:hypothetical protein
MSDIQFSLVVVLIIVLFYGDPDLLDALITYLSK